MKRLWAALLVAGIPYMAAGQLVADMIDTPVAISFSGTQEAGENLQVGFESSTTLVPFTGVALQGTATGDSLRGFIRFQSGEAWTDWLPLYIVRSFTDPAFLAAYRSENVRVATRFDIRFETDKTGVVEVLYGGTFHDTSEPVPDGQSHAPRSSDFKILAPTLHDRAEWNAEPFRGTPVPLNRPTYNYKTLHHTAGFAAVTLTEGLEQVKRIQDFHQNGRGWNDIGYHFLMDQEGRLYQGRPFLNPSAPFDRGPPLVRGAHVGGANTGNIGVSLMGCYHPPEGGTCRHTMTEAAVDSLVATFGFLSERYGVSPDAMRGHRDFSSTACPGDNNYAMMDSFRAKIAELLITGNAALGTAALAATADSIGVVALQWKFLTDAGIESFTLTREDDRGRIVTLIEQAGAHDGRWVDATIQEPGAITYTLTAFGTRGRRQILSTATVHVSPEDAYYLSHSFPNPASEQTTIRYFLRQSGIVSLHVYDAAGRRVARLTEAYKSKDSWHSATLNTSDLADGTYYYYLHVDGFADTIFQAARPLVVVH